MYVGRLGTTSSIIKEYYQASLFWTGKLCCLSSKIDSIFIQYYLPRSADFEYYRYNYKKIITRDLIEYMNIESWVNVAHITHMPLDTFNSYNEFEQEAIVQAVNNFVSRRNEEQKKVIEDIRGSQDSSPYVSPMSSLPRPSFQLN